MRAGCGESRMTDYSAAARPEYCTCTAASLSPLLDTRGEFLLHAAADIIFSPFSPPRSPQYAYSTTVRAMKFCFMLFCLIELAHVHVSGRKCRISLDSSFFDGSQTPNPELIWSCGRAAFRHLNNSECPSCVEETSLRRSATVHT